MLSKRVHRLLALASVVAALSATPPVTRAPAAPRGGASTVPVLFDSAFVTPERFSPNGDAILDSVAVFYTLPETTDVLITVSPAGSAGTIRILDSRTGQLPGVQYRSEWRGEDESGLIQPDGLYTVHFDGITVSNRGLRNQRQVRLDRTPPAPAVLEVVPRRFVPGGRDSGVTPVVRVRISRSELDDRIGVGVLDARGALRDSLSPESGFGGDGDYVFLFKNLSLASFTDGVYRLHAFGRDLAGNDSTVVDSLDKNVNGPAIVLSHPAAPHAVQRADSLVGHASDRQTIVSMQADIVIGPDTTTVDLPPRDGAAGPTVRFWLDVSTLFAAEGSYPVRLRGADEDGVADTLLVHLRVDRTPPPAPVPTPPLPQVTKSQILTGTVLVDTLEANRIVVIGGTSDPETLFAVTPRIKFTRILGTGANRIGFKAFDRAGNISAENASTVVWDATAGITAPERFSAGQSIEVNVGGGTARRVSVRILAMDGSLVRTFEDAAAKSFYRFTWDLRTPEGREVRNGAYLVLAGVLHADGSEERLRTMIAVVR